MHKNHMKLLPSVTIKPTLWPIKGEGRKKMTERSRGIQE